MSNLADLVSRDLNPSAEPVVGSEINLYKEYGSVRLNIEHVSIRELDVEAESFAHGETFMGALQEALSSFSGDPGVGGVTIYYTNEDSGYYFYLESDLMRE